jgi:Spy/CpxP family protein refolding chaperone
MKKKTIIGVGLVLAVALMVTVAFAGGMGRGFGPGYGFGYGYPAIPNLTAEQSSKIQALQKAHLDEISPLRDELLKKSTELRSLWSTSNPGQAAITAKQKEILDLRTKLQEKGTNFRLEISKLLPQGQQAQVGPFGHGMGFGPGKGRMGRMGNW